MPHPVQAILHALRICVSQRWSSHMPDLDWMTDIVLKQAVALASVSLQSPCIWWYGLCFAACKECVALQAHMKKGRSQQAHYNLDRLGVQSALHLPIMEASAGSSSNNARPQALQDALPDMPEDFKLRLASSLAAEFSKKVRGCSAVHSAIRAV